MVSNSNSETFKANRLIFAHPPSERLWHRIVPANCLWEAPAFIEYRYILGSLVEYRNNQSVKHLFNDILGICNISSISYVEQLQRWKAEGKEIPNIIKIYHHLSRDTGGDEYDPSYIR